MTKNRSITCVLHPSKLLALPPEISVSCASQLMRAREVGAVLVMSGAKLLGIVTERDINFGVVALGRDPETTCLSAIMTPDPDTVPHTARIAEAMDLMEANGYRHIPVVKGGTVLGIVSIRDIFAELRKDLEENIALRDEFMFGSSYSLPFHHTVRTH